jgi:hypothetical protein
MSGAERQRRYWRRLRARLASPAPSLPPPGLTWKRKTREAIGSARDGIEYVVALVTEDMTWEVNYYDATDRLRLLGDGYRSMAEGEQAADRHHATGRSF